MKEITDKWLNGWKMLLLAIATLILGFPTLGYAWVYAAYRVGEYGQEDTESWKLTAVRALEPWVHFWRGFALFFLGFPSLGYTWFLMAHLEEPFFWGLRSKCKDA